MMMRCFLVSLQKNVESFDHSSDLTPNQRVMWKNCLSGSGMEYSKEKGGENYIFRPDL